MLPARLSPPVLSAVVLVMQASRSSAFSTLTSVRGASLQARPLAVRGVSSQGGAGGRGVAPIQRKGVLAPSLLRMASSTAGPPASKGKVCCSHPTDQALESSAAVPLAGLSSLWARNLIEKASFGVSGRDTNSHDFSHRDLGEGSLTETGALICGSFLLSLQVHEGH